VFGSLFFTMRSMGAGFDRELCAFAIDEFQNWRIDEFTEASRACGELPSAIEFVNSSIR
jgi:hypothetical protein